jgi:uncharacterized membrane protein YdfJ with MMPL/SSD domain
VVALGSSLGVGTGFVVVVAVAVAVAVTVGGAITSLLLSSLPPAVRATAPARAPTRSTPATLTTER